MCPLPPIKAFPLPALTFSFKFLVVNTIQLTFLKYSFFGDHARFSQWQGLSNNIYILLYRGSFKKNFIFTIITLKNLRNLKNII